jgi:Asp-tRNA(Asn)/Glu-tRNA(Gln) amidotransferase A subunit family amidase
MDLTRMTAAQLGAAIAAGETSAVEVTQAHLDRLAAVDDRVHAFQYVDTDGVLAAARAVDERRSTGQALGPLAGVTLALKDVIVTRGVPTTVGSRILEGWIPPSTRPSRRSCARPASSLGKTNMTVAWPSTRTARTGRATTPGTSTASGRLVRRPSSRSPRSPRRWASAPDGGSTSRPR